METSELHPSDSGGLDEPAWSGAEEAPPGKRRWILPFVFLLLGLGVLALLVKSRPQVEREVAPVVPPLVRTVTVEPKRLALTVESQGTVQPSTEASLVVEVPGKVVWVSPSFAAGGFFRAGEPLVRLDRRDFELAVVRAQAEVSRSNVRLSQIEAEAALAKAEWQELGEGRVASPLVLRLPQVEEAKAVVQAAEASLQVAKLNLERTTIRSPYAGRVRIKQADLGQYLAPGQPVGGIYGVDYAEVRLPVPNAQLAYLELPLAYRDEGGSEPGPVVELSTVFAGRTHHWQGRIVRTEGEIDPQSRLVNLVARVDDPYGRGQDELRPPLAVGLFVEAEIQGMTLNDVTTLPRSALLSTALPNSANNEYRVLVLDREDRLRFRSVEVLRRSGSEVLVSGGLSRGERVCISTLEAPVDGMVVRTLAEPAEEAAS
ncbi:MAG: efflux RND transporter periplasmic adaptor subunit [Deltaproteobacteria bacterium]|nr:efflux RND transporter periplasmic adaptor subunit [Deltaproteobacteria bacterium]